MDPLSSIYKELYNIFTTHQSLLYQIAVAKKLNYTATLKALSQLEAITRRQYNSLLECYLLVKLYPTDPNVFDQVLSIIKDENRVASATLAKLGISR